MKQGVVWSKSKGKIGDSDLTYVVNQTLMFGDLKEIAEMIKNKGKRTVKNIFIRKPLAIYSRPAFKFIKEMVLGVKLDLDEKRYVKTLY